MVAAEGAMLQLAEPCLIFVGVIMTGNALSRDLIESRFIYGYWFYRRTCNHRVEGDRQQ